MVLSVESYETYGNEMRITSGNNFSTSFKNDQKDQKVYPVMVVIVTAIAAGFQAMVQNMTDKLDGAELPPRIYLLWIWVVGSWCTVIAIYFISLFAADESDVGKYIVSYHKDGGMKAVVDSIDAHVIRVKNITQQISILLEAGVTEKDKEAKKVFVPTARKMMKLDDLASALSNVTLHKLDTADLMNVERDTVSNGRVPYLRVPVSMGIGFNKELCDAMRVIEEEFRAEHEREGVEVKVTIRVDQPSCVPTFHTVKPDDHVIDCGQSFHMIERGTGVAMLLNWTHLMFWSAMLLFLPYKWLFYREYQAALPVSAVAVISLPTSGDGDGAFIDIPPPPLTASQQRMMDNIPERAKTNENAI